MTKLEYPGFLLWWQDKNSFPLTVAKEWQPWYLWPEESLEEQDHSSPSLPAKWLTHATIKMHQE